ncbi:MAG: FAD-dependent oxidoreductase [Actinomycetota bacterium]
MVDSESPTASVCILGAGPHGLSMALHLQRADPTLASRMVVIDPSGDWMTTWESNFRRLDIDVLRSPSVHHPGPDVDGLSSFVHENGLPTSHLPYDVPRSDPFMAFCRELVDTNPIPRPVAGRPTAIRPHAAGVGVEVGGRMITAERLIVATNPHRRELPRWIVPILGRTRVDIRHADDIDLPSGGDLAGRTIVVVGGGLSAGHLACGAASLGADVTLVSRRPLTERSFDTDPGWLGPKYLRDYDLVAAPEDRLAQARAARGGGTMPGWMLTRIRNHAQAGTIRLCEGDPIEVAEAADTTCRLILRSGSSVEADGIWLATGTTPDLRALRALEPVLPDIATVDGLPVPDDGLRIGRHPIHVMGRLAMLRLGPASGNLWGARVAARRITTAITGVEVQTMSKAERRRFSQR